MERIKIFHISFAIPWARRQATLHWDELKQFVEPKQKNLFLTALDEIEKKGYEAIPPCENITLKGLCAGHKKDTAAKQVS